MFLITSGSANSINLNILIKSQKILEKNLRDQFIIFTDSDKLLDSGLQVKFFKGSSPLGLVDEALKRISSQDILITLPANKADLKYKGLQFKGYTDYLNQRYQQKNFMTFFTPKDVIVLLNDHIPLIEVEAQCLSIAANPLFPSLPIERILEMRPDIKNIEFYGINPHCGEGGIISKSDSVYFDLITPKIAKYKNLKVELYCSADSKALSDNSSHSKLKIFTSHDQALPLLKFQHHFFSFNATIGLPFMRATMAHGTAAENTENPNIHLSSFLYMIKFLNGISLGQK